MTEERKTFTPTNVTADAPGSITAEFATLNQIDHDGDVTLPGAFRRQVVRIQPFGHNTSEWSIGKGSIRESGNKAILEGVLNLDMVEGREAHASLKFDMEHGTPLQEWSYIFDVLESEPGTFQGKRVRFLKKLKVFSVDPVFLGAGLGTRTTAVKSAAATLAQEMARSQELLCQLELQELKREFMDIQDSMLPLHIEVDAKDVSPVVREVAGFVVDRLTAGWELGEPPALKFFRVGGLHDRQLLKAMPHRIKVTPWRADEEKGGMAEPGGKTVWVNADMTPLAVAHVIVHELRHVEIARKRQDSKRWSVPAMSRSEEEQQCDFHAQSFLLRHRDALDELADAATMLP